MKHLTLSSARSLLATLLAVATMISSAHGQNGAVSAVGRSASLNISGSNFEIHELRPGAPAFLNRDYKWVTVPSLVDGWQFTELSGGVAAQLSARPATDGFVYVASAEPLSDSTLPANSHWETVGSDALSYGTSHTPLRIYRTACKANVPIAIPEHGWAGALVLAPALSSDVGNAAIAPSPAVPVPAALPASRPPGVIIDYIPADTKAFVGSPSIAILPDGTYVASHDIFGDGPGVGNTCVFRSADRGATWKPTTVLTHQFFSTLFVHRGTLYLLGTSRSGGTITIRRSDDGGVTWTTPHDGSSGVLTGPGNHTAPTPIVEFNGRLWRAMEWNAPSRGAGYHFQGSVISAPADSDLLNAASWTRTNFTPPTPADNFKSYWLEGNAVAAPGGEIVDIMRIWRDGIEKAALLHVSADGTRIHWNRSTDTIDMPGGGVKFTIRYDPISRRYWSLVNKQRRPDALRNVLTLISSPDLRHWEVEATLLQHPDRTKHAFQYVDWLFDGDDIVAVSRTSWNGDTFHNANYLTFHRLSGFRTARRTIGP